MNEYDLIFYINIYKTSHLFLWTRTIEIHLSEIFIFLHFQYNEINAKE